MSECDGEVSTPGHDEVSAAGVGVPPGPQQTVQPAAVLWLQPPAVRPEGGGRWVADYLSNTLLIHYHTYKYDYGLMQNSEAITAILVARARPQLSSH